MQDTLDVETYVDIRPGDHFTMDVPIYRRWWQFWKPRVIWERRSFVAIEKLEGSALSSAALPAEQKTYSDNAALFRLT